MTAEERQRAIVGAARRAGAVEVTRLARDLGVARETVRRDLRVLEEHGLLRRTHGGAYPVESAGFETTLALRATRHVPEKRRIAAAAAELTGEAETVFVDEGFAPQLIAESLPRDRALTVVTASLTNGPPTSSPPVCSTRRSSSATACRWTTTPGPWTVSRPAPAARSSSCPRAAG
jgi:DeoR/GlpR family transcriptional regulator of sugar metabolism